MHAYFQNLDEPKLLSTGSVFLKTRGQSPEFQVLMRNEIERFGIQQLLKSRGARILEQDRSDSERLADWFRPGSNFIIVSCALDNDDGGQTRDLLRYVAEIAPELPILTLCGASAKHLAENTLIRIPNPGEVITGDYRLDAGAILEAVRRLIDGIPNEEPLSSMPVDHDRMAGAINAIRLLSSREFEVLSYAALGFSNIRIAESMQLTIRTVSNHLGLVFMKLGLSSDARTNSRVSAVLAYSARNAKPTGASQLKPVHAIKYLDSNRTS